MNKLRKDSEKYRNNLEYGYGGGVSLFRRGINLACSLPFWKYVFRKNCEALEVNCYQFDFSTLPSSFNEYKLLFVSDLHLEIEPSPLAVFLNLDLPEHDVVILGGDFFDCIDNIQEDKLVSFITKFDKPIYAILGNHDKLIQIKLLKSLGVTVLLNESVVLNKGDERILLTGIDDMTHYKSELQQQCCIEANEAFDGFKIMASHSPDFLEDAEQYNYDLQLSGHTHGGQFKIFNYIVFPQTKYVFAIANKWQYKKMAGYTSTGFGSSGYPIRNIAPEIAIIKLNKK